MPGACQISGSSTSTLPPLYGDPWSACVVRDHAPLSLPNSNSIRLTFISSPYCAIPLLLGIAAF